MDTHVIVSTPDVLNGTPVFVGTHVPLQTLLDYLEDGDTIDDFLDDFPAVSRHHVFTFLKEAKEKVLAESR